MLELAEVCLRWLQGVLGKKEVYPKCLRYIRGDRGGGEVIEVCSRYNRGGRCVSVMPEEYSSFFLRSILGSKVCSS
jgi:hypothetical protein